MNDPIIERRTCVISGNKFAIFESDKLMLEKISPKIAGKKYHLPLPQLAPEIRHRLHTIYTNKRHLYHETCALSWEKTISRIHPSLWLKVYTNVAWSEGDRDYTDYGLEYTWGNPQDYILKLARSTPYQDMIWSFSNVKNNARYTNHTADIFDSYLVFDAHTIEKSAYSSKINRSKFLFDCTGVSRSEYCYECLDCQKMYSCLFCQDSSWCSNSVYLLNCHGCTNCIWCVNLIQQEYCIFNKQVTKEEFEKYRKKLISQEYKMADETREKLCEKATRRAVNIQSSEESCWNHIVWSTWVVWCHLMVDCQDCRRCSSLNDAQDCRWTTAYGHNSFLLYNSSQVGRFSNNLFCSNMVGKGENLLYCLDTKKSKNCFWCVNLKQKEYCIFNKQYTKETYEQLVPQLIEEMEKLHQRWRFLPSSASIFPYNDTAANEIYPAQKIVTSTGEIIEQNKWWTWIITLLQKEGDIVDAVLDLWWDEKMKIKRRLKNSEINIPDWIETVAAKSLMWSAESIDNSILQKAILCESTSRPFRLIKQELDFYRKHKLPLPKKHPDVRYEERSAKRPWREVYLRTCDSTWEQMLSMYPQNVPFRVLCEEEYKKEIFG